MSFWGCSTAASRRYQRRAAGTMAAYVVVVFGASWFVRHEGPRGWHLYFWAVLPAIPVIVTLALMGKYLQEETDEYQRLLTTRSILVGTAALLATGVVNDFLRSLTTVQAIPPFAAFVLFMVAFAVAQLVQTLRDRGSDDEPSA